MIWVVLKVKIFTEYNFFCYQHNLCWSCFYRSVISVLWHHLKIVFCEWNTLLLISSSYFVPFFKQFFEFTFLICWHSCRLGCKKKWFTCCHHAPHLGFYWNGVQSPRFIRGMWSFAVTGVMTCSQVSKILCTRIYKTYVISTLVL